MKRNRRFRRRTIKRTKYGGMEAAVKPKISLAAEPFVSAAKREWKVNAPEWYPPAPPVAPAPPPAPPNAGPNGAPNAPVDPFLPNSEFDTMYKAVLAPFAENAVAIDCEMVGLKPDDISALAHVAITDFNGNRIYEKYVIPRGGIGEIMNYRTRFSGITRAKLLPFVDNPENQYDLVKDEVHGILNGKIIVGHGLDSDFDVLEYATLPIFVWDSTKIPKYLRTAADPPEGKPFKLKALAAKIGNNIQRNEVNAAGKPKGHSPLEDARAAMNLFRTYMGYPKIDYSANGRTWRN